MNTLELLSPAGSADIGIAAINHGADAVYIGAPAFGARAAAGNSLADIERLVRHAHFFHARVYIAINTILKDTELKQAVALCHQLYNLGADALIIQDMGLLECDLPPIPLHASTQMDNRSAEKVAFLESIGFQQVVLARELSLEQIKTISSKTSVVLECFIHGALCVSYSGQCYISEVMAGRSANRGECAQFCRHKFDLRRKNGEILQQDSYLLSLQDLNLSGKLEALSSAGVRSFKIEGRLKDKNYVKNVTAAYRKELDTLLTNGNFSAASSGQCRFSFTPDPEKSFHRGRTDYFLTRKRNAAAEIRSPKATGAFVGTVAKTAGKVIYLQEKAKLAAGDGLCCFINNQLCGFRVNRVDGDNIIVKEHFPCPPGTKLYRNIDSSFTRALQQSISPRKLALELHCLQQQENLRLIITDEDGISSTTSIQITLEEAKQPQQGQKAAYKQLVKTGGTPFLITKTTVTLEGNPFLSAANLNHLRRLALDNHHRQRLANYIRKHADFTPSSIPWIRDTISTLDNIGNKRTIDFFRRHRAKCTKDVPQLRPQQTPKLPLMQTRYCIKFQLGICPQTHGKKGIADTSLILSDRQGEYELFFHCNRCEMTLQKLLE